MTVNEIIKAQEICFLRQNNNECGYCKECPLVELDEGEHCQKFLAEATINKLNELTVLLDDTINYRTLESLQEENTVLKGKIDKILELLHI